MSLSVGARPDLDVEPGRAGRLLEFPRRYPLVAVTLAVGAVVVGLLVAGQPGPAQWLGSGWALVVAARVAWGMVADGYRPDRYDIIGALVCLAGMAVIIYAPRGN